MADKQNIFGAIFAAVLPDGNGGCKPCPEILTEQEAIMYLRLDTVDIKHPEATLRRYRDAGVLHGVQISKGIFFPRTELDRFIKTLMEQNPR